MQDENADLFTYDLTTILFTLAISAVGGVAVAGGTVFLALALAKLPPLAALCGGCSLALALHHLWFDAGKIATLLLMGYVGFGGRISLPVIF